MADSIKHNDDGTSSLDSFEDLQSVKPGIELNIANSCSTSSSPGDMSGTISCAQANNIAWDCAPNEGHIRRVKASEKWITSYFEDTNKGNEGENGESTVLHQKPIFDIVTTIRTAKADVDDSTVYSDSDSESESDVLNDDSSEKTEEMVVYSEHLINALHSVRRCIVEMDVFKKSAKIKAPFRGLMRSYQALRLYRIAQPQCHSKDYATATVKHIDVLLGFLEENYSSKLAGPSVGHQQKTPVVEFHWLSDIFRPGEVVYCRGYNDWKPAIIQDVRRVVTDQHDKLQITCWNVTFFLGRMIKLYHRFSIMFFAGEQSIYTLDVIPAGCFRSNTDKANNQDVADRKHILMGRLYWELVKQPTYKECSGELFSDAPMKTPCGRVTGRVIVDASEVAWPGGMVSSMMPSYNPGPAIRTDQGAKPQAPGITGPQRAYIPQHLSTLHCECKACRALYVNGRGLGSWTGLVDLNPLKDEPPKNDLYYLVCMSTVRVFVLSTRRWGYASVDSLSNVSYNMEAFKHLVLDPSIKLTVKTLVGKFAATERQVSPWPKDLIRNKGEGRIFLLHGSPGVGKTCTAECVAELARRPLLSITSGDLVAPVEESLDRFLKLGEKYGAVVLLDEADVYLEARRARDLRRNALVSVFLRALEYYRGVLFLTTNRVASFDPAFTSRIHVALHYRRLTEGDRQRIWANNFARLEHDSAGKISVSVKARAYVEDDVREMGALRWNGREIRNAVQTAVALAETEADEKGRDTVCIEARHLRQVAKMSRGFQNFMHKAQRAEEGVEKDSDEEEEEEEEEEDEVEEVEEVEDVTDEDAASWSDGSASMMD